MKTQCPYCNEKFNAPDNYIFKRVKCIKCGQSFEAKPITSEPSDTKGKSKTFNIMELKSEEGRTFWKQLTDFFSFRTMILPQLLVVAFTLLFAGTTITTIITTIRAIFEEDVRGSIVICMWGWIMLFWFRIVMEWFIVLFRMNATLTNIQKLLEKRDVK